jgi:methyltransferase
VLKTVSLLIVVFAPMLLERHRSRRNESALRAGGAIEPSGDVYPLMQVAYPACFLAMIAEGWSRGPSARSWTAAGAATFAAGKTVKYWAMATLGPRWSFRVLVPPGATLLATGPYRWLRHPNYVGIGGELTGVAMLAGAPVTGLLSCLVFGSILLARIKVEERAHGNA